MRFHSQRLVMWYHQSPPKNRMNRTIPQTGLNSPTAKQISIPASAITSIYLLRHQSKPFGSTLQSCWMTRWPPLGGTGEGDTTAVDGPGIGAGRAIGGGAYCGTVNVGGGANCATQGIAKLARTATARIFRMLLLPIWSNCNPAQCCVRNWIGAIP